MNSDELLSWWSLIIKQVVLQKGEETYWKHTGVGKYVDENGSLPCWLPRGQRLSHQRWIWRFHYAQVTKYTSNGNHPGFETKGRRHQKSKPRVSVAPQKRLKGAREVTSHSVGKLESILPINHIHQWLNDSSWKNVSDKVNNSCIFKPFEYFFQWGSTINTMLPFNRFINACFYQYKVTLHKTYNSKTRFYTFCSEG